MRQFSYNLSYFMFFYLFFLLSRDYIKLKLYPSENTLDNENDIVVDLEKDKLNDLEIQLEIEKQKNNKYVSISENIQNRDSRIKLLSSFHKLFFLDKIPLFVFILLLLISIYLLSMRNKINSFLGETKNGNKTYTPEWNNDSNNIIKFKKENYNDFILTGNISTDFLYIFMKPLVEKFYKPSYLNQILPRNLKIYMNETFYKYYFVVMATILFISYISLYFFVNKYVASFFFLLVSLIILSKFNLLTFSLQNKYSILFLSAFLYIISTLILDNLQATYTNYIPLLNRLSTST